MAHIDHIQLEENPILWSDRKRYLGLPISFTKYTLDEDRLYIKKGFLSTQTDETLLYRILDVKSTQSLWQRIFGVGTVTLFCADQSNPELKLENVKASQKVHRFLSQVIEERRQNKGIIGREMYGTADPDGDCDHDDFDAPLL